MIKILFSEPFFYVFLAIVLIIVSLIKTKKFQEIFLIVFSLGVYLYLANYYIILLLFSIIFNYIMG
ncbi:MAG: MBOAT family protein, partial [Nanoarchaeota archaeon]|nr:MBOAT family protein [Nanoarchaeota archaeon]